MVLVRFGLFVFVRHSNVSWKMERELVRTLPAVQFEWDVGREEKRKVLRLCRGQSF